MIAFSRTFRLSEQALLSRFLPWTLCSIPQVRLFRSLPLHPLPLWSCVLSADYALRENRLCTESVALNEGGTRRSLGSTYQGRGTCIDKLVLSASRDNHQISSFYILILSIDRCFGNSRGESQSLVYGMNLSYFRKRTCTLN